METVTALGAREESAALLVLVPLAPLLGALLLTLLGPRLQRRGPGAISAIAVGAMAVSALAAVLHTLRLVGLPPHARCLVDELFPMFHVGALRVDAALTLDPLSATMALVVTLVGTLIHVYATGYMKGDPSYWRFFASLNLFCFAMLLLVLGDSLVVLFVGWEGVGLASYLLIGFWYGERKNAAAGRKAFVVNRVGDWALLVALGLLFWGMGGAWAPETFQLVEKGEWTRDLPRTQAEEERGDLRVAALIPSVRLLDPTGGASPAHGEEGFQRPVGSRPVAIGPTLSLRNLRDQLALTYGDRRPLVDGGELPVSLDGAPPAAVRFDGLRHKLVWGMPLATAIVLLLLVGAAGKSAQIPLYVWLPDAMAGPTPVSALIHAATMVTAGVYLFARLSFLVTLSPEGMAVIAIVGAATALLGALLALVQHDVKRVLAYSTVSQLGLMFVAVGTGAFTAALFHLVTHACFKALLFLAAGSLIHAMHKLTHARAHGAAGEHTAKGDDEHAPRADAATGDAARSVGPAFDDPQDLRNMGGLAALLPSTKRGFLVGAWALAGLPWAAGFFSKDMILWGAFSSQASARPWLGPTLWLVLLVVAALTAVYTFRAYYLAFHHHAATAEQRKHVAESPASMTGVLGLLALACLVVGPLLGPPPLLTHLFHARPPVEAWLAPVLRLGETVFVGARAQREAPLVEGLLALASIGVAVLGWAIARALFADGARGDARVAALAARLPRLHRALLARLWVDELYAATVVRATVLLTVAAAFYDEHVVDAIVRATGFAARAAAWLSGAFDRVVVDGAVNLVARATLGGGRELARSQSGRLPHYLLAATAGVLALVLLAYLA